MSLTRPGLSDLSQSLFAALGLPGTENRLQLASSKRICLLLIDGLGTHSLARYGSEFSIFSELTTHTQMSSHFPSTTVTNLTSLGTGVLPGVHGMLGYTVRIPESGSPGRLMNPLKWDPKIDPQAWQVTPTLFERAAAAGFHVTTIGDKRYAQSGFTQASLRGATYRSSNQISESVSEAVNALAEPHSFAYVYTNIVDNAGHNFGVGSQQWLLALREVAELTIRLANELPRGSSLYLTADHGMINAGERIVLGQDNPLMNSVELVGGEPRVRHIYLDSELISRSNLGYVDEIAATWREYLGNKATIYTKSEAVSAGLFGVEVRTQSLDRLGDLIAIAQDEIVFIDPTRVEKESAIIGQHGGLSAAEVEIPLLGAVI